MRTVIVAVLIAFNVQVHADEAKKPEESKMTDTEFDEVLNKMVAKLSERVFQETDLDGTTLAKPGAAMAAARPALPAARPFLQGRSMPVMNAKLNPAEEAALEEVGRRAVLNAVALMPAVLGALATPANAASDNSYVAALLANSKANKEKNDKTRKEQQKFRSRRFSIDLFNDPAFFDTKDQDPAPWSSDVWKKQAADKKVLMEAMSKR